MDVVDVLAKNYLQEKNSNAKFSDRFFECSFCFGVELLKTLHVFVNATEAASFFIKQ